MEKTIGGSTIADFKSGWRTINKVGPPTARVNFPSTPRDCWNVPILLRIRMLAVMSRTPTLAVSEGWKEKKPMSSQRRAPLAIVPSLGIRTRIRGITQIRYTQWAMLSQNR